MVLKKLVKRIQGAPERWKNRLKIVKNTAEKVNNSDKNFINKIKNRKITKNIEKGNAAGRIQEKLIKGGHTKTGLRKIGEKNQAFKDNRKKMDNLRKTNPEKYKKLKKEQRRKENIAAMNAKSSTWD